MNERIRELARNADLNWHNHWNDDDSNSLKKFAELIVQECLSQVEKQYKPMLEDETMMKDKHWVGYVECGVDSRASIKEHFGVTE